MRALRVSSLVVTVVLCGAAGVRAQGLGDAAAAEKERKARNSSGETTRRPATYTGDDLLETRTSAVGGATGAAAEDVVEMTGGGASPRGGSPRGPAFPSAARRRFNGLDVPVAQVDRASDF